MPVLLLAISAMVLIKTADSVDVKSKEQQQIEKSRTIK